MVPPMPPAVHLRSAVALTGRFPALAGVDLDASPGEVVVLAGANGAGKTSLLRLCAGLLRVTSGTAMVLGCDVRHQARAVRRRVGLLGHAAALYDDLTVVENVRFAVRAAGGDGDAVDDALERTGLVGRLRRTAVGRLSAGQRRRVDLAALIARRPELWLLDEPHASLDTTGRHLVDDIVRAASAAGATVLLASHELATVLPVADQVVTLAGGRVVDRWARVEVADGGPAGADGAPGADRHAVGAGPDGAGPGGAGGPAAVHGVAGADGPGGVGSEVDRLASAARSAAASAVSVAPGGAHVA
jgi:heme ABC exporter ATP-binding subunit CcmA